MDTRSVDWVFTQSDTIYMDGTSIYYVRLPGKPGHVTSLRLTYTQAEGLRSVFAACLAERG